MSDDVLVQVLCTQCADPLKQGDIRIAFDLPFCAECAEEVIAEGGPPCPPDDVERVTREQGPPCENCGNPVEVGQVVLPWDDVGEMHADCEHPFSLRYVPGEGDPAPVVLLGEPMQHVPLAALTASRSYSDEIEEGVTQEDRKAAARLYAHERDVWDGYSGCSAIREGCYDEAPIVQAFRAHRVSALSKVKDQV